MKAFTVIDKKTGKYPDLQEIALTEDWAKHLMYCDMEGFAIQEDGTLILMDECGNMAYCPEVAMCIKIIQSMTAKEFAKFCKKAKIIFFNIGKK